MSNLPLHRLIAAAGGLALPLIAGDAPAFSAPVETIVSLQLRTGSTGLDRRDDPLRRDDPTEAGAPAPRAEVDK